MKKNKNKIFALIILVLFFLLSVGISVFSQTSSVGGNQGSNEEAVFPDQSTLNTQKKYTPGIKWSGISLSEDEFAEIPTEKCQGSTNAKVMGSYFLTSKVYIFKTDAGYGVADINLSYRDLETGIRRSSLPKKASCKVRKGMILNGEFDCKGARMVRKEPYEGCAYDVKVWEHSLNQAQAFSLVIGKLQNQFNAYRQECVFKKPKSIKDRMQVF